MSTIRDEIIRLSAKLDAEGRDSLASVVKNSVGFSCAVLLRAQEQFNMTAEDLLEDGEKCCFYLDLCLKGALEFESGELPKQGGFSQLLGHDA